MADREYTRHQQNIIKRYYDNREQIDSQRLSELCTNLYLASGKKQEKMWVTAQETMTRLGVKQSRIDHIMSSKDPAILAELVKDIERGVVKLEPPKKQDKPKEK